jgi:hypothetical protein
LDWRRDDWGYAGGTIVAAGLVAFLVAGNFGLVRSPFTPAELDPAPVQIPALVVGNRASLTAPMPLPTHTAPARSAPAEAPSERDLAPPTGDVNSGGTTVSVAQGSTISGVANDVDSGVNQVLAIFDDGSGEPKRVPATVTCEDASRTSCSWTARVPDVIGNYTVAAQLTDRAGNVGVTDTQEFTAVNLGKAVEDLTDGLLATLTTLGAALLG